MMGRAYLLPLAPLSPSHTRWLWTQDEQVEGITRSVELCGFRTDSSELERQSPSVVPVTRELDIQRPRNWAHPSRSFDAYLQTHRAPLLAFQAKWPVDHLLSSMLSPVHLFFSSSLPCRPNSNLPWAEYLLPQLLSLLLPLVWYAMNHILSCSTNWPCTSFIMVWCFRYVCQFSARNTVCSLRARPCRFMIPFMT